MTYSVKEIFYTLQGEGTQAGRAAVFCRFAGCNLWSGREIDRSKAVCKFCDTDFVGTDSVGGGKFETAQALARAIDNAWTGDSAWTNNSDMQFVVVTGGEPAPRRPPYRSGAGLGEELSASIWRPRPFAMHASSRVRTSDLSAVAPSEWC
jgi:organic radical activating enzyme